MIENFPGRENGKIESGHGNYLFDTSSSLAIQSDSHCFLESGQSHALVLDWFVSGVSVTPNN